MPRKPQGQGVPLWRALLTGPHHPSFLPVAAAVALAAVGARADEAALAPREVPAKSIPVPTDVSPGMQKLIAAPLNPLWHDLWKTGEEWRKAADKMDAGIVPTIPAMAERLHVKVEPSTMDGVKVFIVTPEQIPPENRNRLLIHIHGGCYVLFPGEAGATEAITMAGLEHFKVISVDYRMPPEAYFPAAIDDVLTVYKAAQRTTDPKNMAIFGTSAGGALTLEVILRAKEQGVPLPGAISAGTPMSDVTKTGDSFYTNDLVDNVLVSRDGFCDAATVPQLASRLLAQMLVEKLGNLAERDGRLGQPIVEEVLRVRLAFVDLQLRLHPGRAERPMHPHRIAQQQVAGAAGQDGGREAVHVAVDRR